MKSTQELKAAKKFNLGYFVREQLEIQKMTEKTLARKLGMSVEKLKDELEGHELISDILALKLSRILGKSDNYWRNLKASYLQWKKE